MSRIARKGRIFGLLTVLGLLGACTEAGLEPIAEKPRMRDDKLEVSGHICTREPESLEFPVRVLFLVDSSESMAVTDPPDPVTGETRRERAVRATWKKLLEDNPTGVKIGIVRFSSQAQSRTAVDHDGDGLADSYFTDSPLLLEVATRALATTDRVTNFVNALSEAFYELRIEMLAAELESLPLSKYVVIMLTDGVPDVDSTEKDLNSQALIMDSIGSLGELANIFKVGELTLNTVYLSAGEGPAKDQFAQELLQDMAEAGEGTYRSVPNNEELNFLHVSFASIRRVFTLRRLSALNMNTVMDTRQTQLLSEGADGEGGELDPELLTDLDGDGVAGCGELLTDSDTDGLSDAMELLICTDPTERDTDGDGLNDRVEWEQGLATPDEAKGLDPNDGSDTSCLVPAPCRDEDGDGRCDCLVDGDGDGICDCVDDPDLPCADLSGRDCLDADYDGWCDCRDLDEDGRCDQPDEDGDQLDDCEEQFIGTASNGADSDADGVPDLFEHRFHTNPSEYDDQGDLDWDLTRNGLEIALATDPLCEDASLRSRTAYRYELHDRGLVGASSCYDFKVSNVTLGSTWPVLGQRWPGNGWNRILVFASEVAFDDPTTYARFRIGCVEASYQLDGDFKNPPSGRMRLEDEDFVDAADFDPALHCKRP